jgi:hypothetical protein
MKQVPLTSLKHISWKGLSCKQGVLSKFKLSSISYIWLWHLQHHLICHVWAQTHCLTADKHLGCYNPPPLKESRPEIQGERLSREDKHVIHFPTSAIALGYLASSIRELVLVTRVFTCYAYVSMKVLNYGWYDDSGSFGATCTYTGVYVDRST